MFQAINPRQICFTERNKGAFWNARQTLNHQTLASTRESIRTVGLNQPIVVRLLPDKAHELVAGERRLRCILWLLDRNAECYNKETKQMEPAHKVYATVECRVEVDCDDKRASKLSVCENLERENVNELDLMTYCIDLCNLVAEDGTPVYRRDEVQEVIGRSQGWISQTMSLYDLSDRAKKMLGDGSLPRTTALYLLKLDPDKVDMVLDLAAKMAVGEHVEELEAVLALIENTEDELQTADMTIAVASRLGTAEDKSAAVRAKSLLDKKLEEAEARQVALRERSPRVTQDTLQLAADRIPGARQGKSNALSHKLIRSELDGIRKLLEDGPLMHPNYQRQFEDRDVEIVCRCMDMFLGQAEERTPQALLTKLYEEEGRFVAA